MYELTTNLNPLTLAALCSEKSHMRLIMVSKVFYKAINYLTEPLKGHGKKQNLENFYVRT